PTLLILIGPDLGQAMVYLVFWAATLSVMRTRKTLIFLTLVAAPFLAWFAWEYVLVGYQKTRLLVSFNPDLRPLDEGFQIIQAHTAIGAGSLWGEGITGGTQSTLNFLSVTESDFI